MRVVYTKESTGFKNELDIDNSLFMVALHGPFTEKQLNLTVLIHIGIVNDVFQKEIEMVQCKKHETVHERFSDLFNEEFLMIFFA